MLDLHDIAIQHRRGPVLGKQRHLLTISAVKKLAGHKKSNKHRRAEDLISKGQDIRILRESDFKELQELG